MSYAGRMCVFTTGQTIYYAAQIEKNKFTVIPVVVIQVIRGSVIVEDSAGNILKCGLSSRRISYTQIECEYVCNLLNNTDNISLKELVASQI